MTLVVIVTKSGVNSLTGLLIPKQMHLFRSGFIVYYLTILSNGRLQCLNL